jgi:hypothetical protein
MDAETKIKNESSQRQTRRRNRPHTDKPPGRGER